MKKLISSAHRVSVDFGAVQTEMKRLNNLPYDDLVLEYAQTVRSPKPALHPKVMIVALTYIFQAKMYKEVDLEMSEATKRRMNNALAAMCFEDLVKGDIVLSVKEKHVGGVIVSECPGFRSAWKEDESHCIDCKNTFPDEYYACKASAMSVQRREQNKQKEVLNTDVVASAPTAVITGNPFRAGTRAALMYEYISGSGRTTVDAVAKYLNEKVKLPIPDAKAAVKSYIEEWAQGKWNYVPRNWDWQVVITKEGAIAYSKKESHES